MKKNDSLILGVAIFCILVAGLSALMLAGPKQSQTVSCDIPTPIDEDGRVGGYNTVDDFIANYYEEKKTTAIPKIQAEDCTHPVCPVRYYSDGNTWVGWAIEENLGEGFVKLIWDGIYAQSGGNANYRPADTQDHTGFTNNVLTLINGYNGEVSCDPDLEPGDEGYVANCHEHHIINLLGYAYDPVGYEMAALYDEGDTIVDFIWIDHPDEQGYDNLLGTQFNSSEAGYLVGYIAGWACAHTPACGAVSTYGGLDYTSVQAFMQGYWYGVDRYNKQFNDSIAVIGWHPNCIGTVAPYYPSKCGDFTWDFFDPYLGAEMTLSHIQQGSRIEFAVAGDTGFGTFWVLDKNNQYYDPRLLYVIGVDEDVSAYVGYDKPEGGGPNVYRSRPNPNKYPNVPKSKVLTSALKNVGIPLAMYVDKMMQEIPEDDYPDFWGAPDLVGNLNNGLVGYAPISNTCPGSGRLVRELDFLIQFYQENSSVFPNFNPDLF